MDTRSLTDIVAPRLDVRWEEFARTHPHLAAAIDRTRLVETAVTRLRDDPRFAQAMKQADLDEARLAAAAQALHLVDQLLARLLTL